MNTMSLTACPLCGGTHLKYAMTCTDRYVSGESFKLFSCEDCDFTFTQDTPSEGDMDKYYNSPTYISHSDTKKGLVNKLYHFARTYMLKRKVRLVIKMAYRTTGNLLDIGTGTGYFPVEMQRKGWHVEAIEKNTEARSYARSKFGLHVWDEDMLNVFEKGRYDVITLWHVMEHLERLDETWEKCHELLTEQGILIVAVPNRASYDAQKYGADWAAYDVPRHLWHFTPATMQRMGANHHFIMAERYPMPFDAFYIAMLSEQHLGRRLPFVRGAYVGLKAWFRALVHKDRSSSMIYIFRKKHHDI